MRRRTVSRDSNLRCGTHCNGDNTIYVLARVDSTTTHSLGGRGRYAIRLMRLDN